MRVKCADTAAVQYENSVCVFYGGDALGDHDLRDIFIACPERVIELCLCREVECARRIVKNDDPGFLKQSPADRDPLALSSGEAHSALCNSGVIAVGLLTDERICLCSRRGGDDFRLGSIRVSKGDIFPDGRREELALLKADCYVFPQSVQSIFFYVDLVEQDAAVHRIIKARDQVYQSALSGPGRTDDGDRLPGCDLEADIRENADPASGIGKVHVLEAEAARDDAGSGSFRIF